MKGKLGACCMVILVLSLLQPTYGCQLRKRIQWLGTGKSVEADLDGDGKVECVTLYTKPRKYEWSLRVDDRLLEDGCGLQFCGFAVIDLDTTDRYKEIVVRLSGPGEGDFYSIYEYRNKNIRRIGIVGDVIEFYGDGSMIVRDYSMSFWVRTVKYFITRQRTIEVVPQEFYYVGVEGVVKESFPIYAKRGSKVVVDVVKPREKILILLSDCSYKEPGKQWIDPAKQWYLVRTERNLLGWIFMKSVSRKIGGIVWGG